MSIIRVYSREKGVKTMKDMALRQYEAKILKEMEESKAFSWKRIWKAIELSSLYNVLGE